MSPTATPVPLNLNNWKSPAPVCAQPTVLGGPPAKSTVMSTFAPFWVSVTVPNGAVPHPPVQWSLVRLNCSASAGVLTSIRPVDKSPTASISEARSISRETRFSVILGPFRLLGQFAASVGPLPEQH